MKNLLISCLIFFFSVTFLIAQSGEVEKIIDRINEFENVEALNQFYDSIQNVTKLKDQIGIKSAVADAYLAHGQYKVAGKIYTIIINKHKIEILDTFDSHYYLAYCCFIEKDYEESIKNYLFYIDNYSDERKKNFCKLYLGNIYYFIGEYELSMGVVETFNSKNAYAELNIKSLKSNIYLQLKDYNSALKQQFSVLSYATDNKNKARAYFGIGNIYFKRGDYHNAVLYYEKSLELEKSETQILNCYLNITSACTRIDTSKAFRYLEKSSLLLSKRNKAQFHPDYAVYYQNLAEYYSALGQHDLAVETLDTCIYNHCFGPAISGDPQDYKIDPMFVNDKLGLVEFLEVKLEIYEKAGIERMDSIFVQLDKVIHSIREDKYNDKSRFFQQQKLSRFYRQAFLYHLDRNEKEKAYGYLQKMKNIILLEKMHYKQAEFVLPDSIIAKDREWRDSIEYLTEITDKTAKLENKVNHLRLQHFNFINNLKEAFPEYHKLRYMNQEISISTIQENLSEHQVLIDYYMDTSAIYIFSLTKDSISFKLVEKSVDFDDNFVRYIVWLNSSPSFSDYSEKKIGEMDSLGKWIHQCLLPSNLMKNELVIIPYDVLFYLPFESLVINEKKSCKYLVCDKYVSYGFSSLLWINSKHVKLDRRIKSFVFSPFENDTSALFLPYANSESNYIHENMKGIIESGLSKKDFIEQAKKSNLHHLISHAYFDTTDNQNSYLYLNDKLSTIKFSDIISEDIPSEMVCLSACNSGNGQLIANEGVISLGRGFLESGAKSIVMSYYSIPDRSSSDIFIRFYTYLLEGESKTKSLTEAKRDYISNSTKFESHPYFWAGLTLHGNEQAIYEKMNNVYYFILILGLLGIVFIFKKLLG